MTIEEKVAALAAVCDEADQRGVDAYTPLIRTILAEPVEGVTLTPEEAARVRQWHSYAARYMTSDDDALAARLGWE